MKRLLPWLIMWQKNLYRTSTRTLAIAAFSLSDMHLFGFFFCKIWPFGETYAVSDPSAKLFCNLIPEVGASMDGADVVHLGATPSYRRRRVGATPTGAEPPKRTSVDKMLAPSCTTSAPSTLAPTSGVTYENSSAEGSGEDLVWSRGQIS
jgi:hypothetical protein